MIAVLLILHSFVCCCRGFQISNSGGLFHFRNHINHILSPAVKKIFHDARSRSMIINAVKKVKNDDIIPTNNSKQITKKISNKDETIAIDKKIVKKTTNDRDEMMSEIINQLMDKLGDINDKGDDRSLSTDQTSLLNGVVRIYCTHSQPNFGMPWQRVKQEFSSSTGFIIEGNRILTNAHAVEYGSLIQVKKRSCEKKYVASVIAVGHECDLAMLSIDDPSFWHGLNALEFGPLPDLLEDVSVIGYPVGGDSISISSGVVSRIEMQEYAQASADLLAIQIDAAVNPGNSGMSKKI